MLDILRLLTAREFTSGQYLAERLGVSRATVHNRLTSMRDFGLAVYSLPGRGYRLSRPVSWLDEQVLKEALSRLGFQLQFADSLDSTNSRLLAQALEGAAHKSVLAAEWQQGGRGRRGRQWLAPLGGGLTFSLLWRFNRPMAELSGLSLVVGLGLTRAIRALAVENGAMAAGKRVAVKWPNDLLHGEAKLAGILIEVQGDALGPSLAVVGVGLNVHLPETSREALDQPAADLADVLGFAPDRNELLSHVLSHLGQVMERFDSEGFSELRREWEKMHAYQGREVSMSGKQGEIRGLVRGVDKDGALLLETSAGLQRALSGEMSLRPSRAAGETRL